MNKTNITKPEPGKKMDYKKEYKDLYLPKTKPMIIQVPPIKYLMVDGKGNPNTSEEYKQAMNIMYGISFTIKMSKMSGQIPEGYFDYVVPPLEGLWQVDDEYFDGTTAIEDKDKFLWTSMIRQPEFVTEEVFAWAKEELHKKKPELDLSKARLVVWEEGLAAQVMHLGTYDEEPDTVNRLEQYIKEQGYINDIGEERRHHEIYLSDPRKTKPENCKTVIRHPIRSV
ncbi:GyrI-like domain-containing protein [Anaerosporobacter faecicola]|uniref:GyrI-like domain-containing protein n=1 Tax=Anaerosporobacter faecicola TaxID=2718714 RepID=UPI00143C39B8|nr:GyrI-like domain-containing protein [Anaerosporobacter faecicola]